MSSDFGGTLAALMCMIEQVPSAAGSHCMSQSESGGFQHVHETAELRLGPGKHTNRSLSVDSLRPAPSGFLPTLISAFSPISGDIVTRYRVTCHDIGFFM